MFVLSEKRPPFGNCITPTLFGHSQMLWCICQSDREAKHVIYETRISNYQVGSRASIVIGRILISDLPETLRLVDHRGAERSAARHQVKILYGSRPKLRADRCINSMPFRTADVSSTIELANKYLRSRSQAWYRVFGN